MQGYRLLRGLALHGLARKPLLLQVGGGIRGAGGVMHTLHRRIGIEVLWDIVDFLVTMLYIHHGLE